MTDRQLQCPPASTSLGGVFVQALPQWQPPHCCHFSRKGNFTASDFRTRPDWPWGQPSLLYEEYPISFSGVKRPRRGVGHPPPPSAEVKERVQLYLYSTPRPSWPVIGWTVPLPLPLQQLNAVTSDFIHCTYWNLTHCISGTEPGLAASKTNCCTQ